MFISLLVANFLISLAVCFVVVLVFRSPINRILQRLIQEELFSIWGRYMAFAVYVVGISGGVRVWDLEKYITPRAQGSTVLELTSERWILEIYRTIIGTLQSIAWVLMLFFIFALIAFVIVKGREVRTKSRAQRGDVR